MAPSLGVALNFFHSQFFVTPPYPTEDCTGKTVVVTGGNVGLGKEAARHYVRLNSDKVIIACRTVAKGEAAKKDIETTTGRTGVVQVWELDLSSYDNVKKFAERARTLDRIDILLENAGVSTNVYTNVAGNESTITTNVVSTFLLAFLMMPKLKETGRKFGVKPNLVIVSSEVHFFTDFPERKALNIFTELNDEKTARMGDRYHVSKLLEVFVCREIAKYHSADQLGLTINFVNPGFCHSELTRERGNGVVLSTVKNILCRTTEVGARTLVHAGLQGPETHGKYMSDCQVTKCAPLVEGAEGPEVQRRVWEELAGKLEAIQPGITKVLDA